MAKFKKMRRYAKKAFRKSKSYAKSSSMGVVETAIGSGIYGFVRQPIADKIPDVGMLGSYSDNAILGGIGALAAWKGKGIVKKAGLIVLANEVFVASSRAKAGFTPQNASSDSDVPNTY